MEGSLSISRRHLMGAAGAFAVLPTLGPEAWAQAKDRLVIGMSLEPPVLDPTKNAAAAIRSITAPSIFESLGRIDRNGEIKPTLPKAGRSPRTARSTSSSFARA